MIENSKLSNYAIVEELEKNPREFVDFLRLSQKHWHRKSYLTDELGNMLKDKWIFRGSSNAIWRLIPSAWRKDKIVESHIENKRNRFIKSGWDLDKIPSYEDLYSEIEIDIIKRFREGLHDFGYPVGWLMNKQEANLSNEDRFEKMLDIACTAQHHGIPTRLLDWTVNPMTAAYFACEPQGRCEKAEKICVWGLNIGSRIFRDNNIKIKVHEQPRNRNDYLRAQQALFTECTNGIDFHRNNNRWPSVDGEIRRYIEKSKEEYNEKILIKVMLKKEDADEVIDILRKEGISRSSIMPSLDNLASDILDSWELDKLL